MKSLTTYITEKMVYNKNSVNKAKYKYFPETKEELKELLVQLIEERGNDGDFNDIDTSEITDMTRLFFKMGKFNGDISKWDVSNVKNMSQMFDECRNFNQPLNDWDVSEVTNMDSMFFECDSFNQPLNNWNICNVKTMKYMFQYCTSFNQNLSDWDVSNKSAWYMFEKCPIEEKHKPKFK